MRGSNLVNPTLCTLSLWSELVVVPTMGANIPSPISSSCWQTKSLIGQLPETGEDCAVSILGCRSTFFIPGGVRETREKVNK